MDENERLQLYRKLWIVKGQIKQLDKLMEEMSELTKEIFKGRVYTGDCVTQEITLKMLEEFGDVEICSEQLHHRLIENGLYDIVEGFKKEKLQKVKAELELENGDKPGYG